MIAYIVAAMPRSGSAWLSTLLSTDDIPCLHDPLAHYSIDDLQAIPERIGLVDTSLFLHVDAVNTLDVPTVVLHRRWEDIERSLQSINLALLPDAMPPLDKIRGMRISYDRLFSNFDAISAIYWYLTGKKLSKQRWQQQKDMHIENAAMIKLTQDICYAMQYEQSMSSGLH